jgi:predicted dehydrogenase
MMSLPRADSTPLRGGPVLRWGILAPGVIARDWVRALHDHTDQRVIAVGSRSTERAEAFAREVGIPESFGSYDELVAHPGIDIVYVAAPHSEHRRLALLAIAAGKHVLVEKPLGVSASDAREIATAATAAGVFAMEAMWSRFLPQTTVLAQLLRDRGLGEVRGVSADLGGIFPFDPTSRAFDPALAGGALLDMGVYPAWFAHFALGTPTRVTATGTLASTGVDEQAALILDYESPERGPAQAVLTTSMIVPTPGAASISGTLARVEFARHFLAPSEFRVVTPDGTVAAEWADPSGFRWRDGLCYQATAVAQHIADGLLQSPIHPLSTSIAVLETLDSARLQLGAA